MSAFHEIQFPPGVSAGAVGGPGFHTTILTLSSGSEQRNVDWANARASYTVSREGLDDTDIAAVIAFFRARRGRAYGFRFKDWNDFRLPFWKSAPGDLDALPTLFTTDGTTATFQIAKVYADTVLPYVRPITKIVTATIALYNNGTLMGQGAGGSQYQVNLNTGVVTLGATVKATTGHLITGSLEFDVPVRFDTDELALTTHKRGLAQWSSITVIEDRVS